jgi:hypothetical protein
VQLVGKRAENRSTKYPTAFSLFIQEHKKFINQEREPEQAFEETFDAFLGCGGAANEIAPGTEKSQSINSVEKNTLNIYFFFSVPLAQF